MGKCTSVSKDNRELPRDQMLGYKEPQNNHILERRSTIKPSANTETSKEAPNAVVSDQPPSQKELDELYDILKTHFLFSMMSEETIKHLIKKMKTFTLNPNQIVYTQGTIGINFYVVQFGKLEVNVNGDTNSILLPRDCFGELGLIQDQERNATVISIEKTVLKGIDRISYRTALSYMNEKKHTENLSFLESVEIFKQLSPLQLQQLLQFIVTQKFASGQNIITEGETGDLFYIIKEGTVHCTKKGILIRDFTVGDYFGEQALIYKSKRRATVTAAGKVVVISIGRQDLVRALGQKLETVIYRNTLRIAFNKNTYLKNLTIGQVDAAIEMMSIKSYAQGEFITTQGIIKGNDIIIILKGSLSSSGVRYRLYDIIGDEELTLENSRRVFKDDLAVEEDTDTASITKKEFEKCIGGDLKSILLKNQLIDVLKNVSIFHILPITKLQKIVEVLKIQEFSSKDIIFQQNSQGDKFYIVKEGSVEVLKNGVLIRIVEANGFFGERAIIMDEARTATVRAISSTKCWVLTKYDFRNLVDLKIQQELLKRIEVQNDQVTLETLCYIKTMPRGIYSNHFLCCSQDSKTFYALKTVSRANIALYNAYGHMTAEVKVLKTVDHPFIGKFIKSFKDTKRIYFLMEHVKGQDLFDILSTLDRLCNDDARFFAATIFLILEYLHSHNIIYRDLKPENIMIDQDGYPKIIDFASAKILENRTYSTVGTPHYMAPEVISGKGYNFTADYWSLGVMVYEFLFNELPFCADETDVNTVYQNILQNSLTYPPGNHISKPFLDQLLMKNPVMRGTYRSIKEHSWFIGTNWDLLQAKEVRTKYKPKTEDFDKNILNKATGNSELLKHIEVTFIQKEELKQAKPKNSISTPAPNNWDNDF
jgi:cGMP-dependent protein kinase 1